MSGLKIWQATFIVIAMFITIILFVLTFCIISKKKSRTSKNLTSLPNIQTLPISKEIKEIRIEHVSSFDHSEKTNNESEKFLLDFDIEKKKKNNGVSISRSFSREDGSLVVARKSSSSLYEMATPSPSPLSGLPESHLGWGHWFTLRDLEIATNKFSKENVVGEGGYGVVYRGELINGTHVAVKKILNHLGQAEKEFKVEVDAIGHVRHKNLVRLLGYCIEGTHRILVYEYMNNGNLEEWLHGAMSHHGYLTWEARMKVLIGTSKALAYLHEAIEPKVVHRDIKSSNILIDDRFNAKISDFGLAKLLGDGKSHVTTRVMGTFGYVAPEYANTGLLNEKSDVYSFGVLVLEAITGRDPVDYARPANEVNLVEWLKMMVGSKRLEEVIDPKIAVKPATRELKRVLLTALRCIDPDSEKRPKMSQVVRMLESEEYPIPREEQRRRKTQEESSDTDRSTPVSRTQSNR
ncbi:unnamed protein product [Cochlearia groenlandica]